MDFPVVFATGTPNQQSLRMHLVLEVAAELLQRPFYSDESNVRVWIDDSQKPRIVGDFNVSIHPANPI